MLAATSNSTSLIVVTTAVAFIGAVAVVARGKTVGSTPKTSPHVRVPIGRGDLAPEPRIMIWLERALVALLIGYVMLDRPFAWIHIPGTPLFIGEMVLGLGVAVMLATPTGINSLIRSSGSLKTLRNYMMWGLILLALAILPYGLDAARDAALWYYGLVALFVVILFASRPSRVPRAIRGFVRFIPIYLIWFPFAVVLPRIIPESIVVPDSNIPIFFHRTGNMAVLAVLAIAFMWLADGDSRFFTPRKRGWLTGLATLVIVFTGLQNRGGMVSSAVVIAALLFLLSKRRTEMMMLMVGALVLVASIGIVFDVKIALFDNRDVSIEQFANNITSIFDQEAGGERQTKTTAWRLEIWTQVLDDVTNDSPIMGFGPGPDLGKRYDISTDPANPLRNPHNSHVGVLARMGWVGIILWAMLWITWGAEMQTLRRRLRYRGRTRESAFVGWLMLTPIPFLVNAIFDPTLEGAQVAMLLWTAVGAGSALVILAQQDRFPYFDESDPAVAEAKPTAPLAVR